MKLLTTTLAAVTLAFVAGAAVPAGATTFAQFGADNSAANMTFTSASPGGALTASAETKFDFLTLSRAYRDLSATFTFNATSTDTAIGAGGYDIQPNLSGAFAFTYDGPTVGTLTTGENLLSGTFSGASLAGPDFGSTAATQDSILSGGSVSFASDVLTFGPSGDQGVSLALTSVLPSLHLNRGGDLASFSGVSTGSFSSDLAAVGGGGGVPEPASWALMLLGVAGVGFARRSSRMARRETLS